MHVMGQMLVVLNPLNAEEFARRGWSKDDVRRYLWEHARRPIADVRACGVGARAVPEDGARRRPLPAPLRPGQSDHPRAGDSAEPEDIHIVVAGGRSYFAAVLPGWGGFGGFAVTRAIRRPLSMEILSPVWPGPAAAVRAGAPARARGRHHRPGGRQSRHPVHHPPRDAPGRERAAPRCGGW